MEAECEMKKPATTRRRKLQGETLMRIRRSVAPWKFCAVPGCMRRDLELDHRIPLSQGGTDEEDNLQWLCHAHHADKTAQEQGFRSRPHFDAEGFPVFYSLAEVVRKRK